MSGAVVALVVAAVVATGCSVITSYEGYVDGGKSDAQVVDSAVVGDDTALEEETLEDAPLEDAPLEDSAPVDTFLADTAADTAIADTACSSDNRQSCGASCADCTKTKGPLARCEAGTCTCPSDATECAGKCVRLATDPLHCGACGAQVEDGSRWCVASTPQCKPTLNVCRVWSFDGGVEGVFTMECPAHCIDVTSEGNHCYVSQTSWQRCYKGSSIGLCINRQCVTKNTSTGVTCGTRLECPVATAPTDPDIRGCLDGMRDPNHCGACNAKCAKDQVCAQGTCRDYVAAKSTADCPPDWTYCTVSGWPYPVCVLGPTCPT